MDPSRCIMKCAVAVVMMSLASGALALEPPTAEQAGRYRRDGSLARRSAAAYAVGNHRLAPRLVQRMLGVATESGKVSAVRSGLPTTGRQRVFALLIAFSDYPGHNIPYQFDWRLFGDGPSAEYPYESLRDYYRRSSYGQLEIEGVTLGWYATPYSRARVEETTAGREALIGEAISHFDDQGHDFAQYDNDGDGAIDYFLVFWAGPHQEWAEFWWGYQRSYENGSFTVDGMRLGAYSWQWESWNCPGPFSARVAIHETGHALGLPDYYDYDDTVGPRGGLGGLDMMDSNWGDHNSFSKYVLGWISPEVHNQGEHDVMLAPSDAESDAVLLMPGEPATDPYGEYYMVQHRRRQGNDAGLPGDGLLIWHVDARSSERGGFLNDNSYSDHKLLRLMEADGLEEIERNLGADDGDFFRPGGVLSSGTTPSSHRYDGAPTNIEVDSIIHNGDTMGFAADLGSGCAIFCRAEIAPTGWPGRRMLFDGDVAAENCEGTAAVQWLFGDGSGMTGDPVGHVFDHPGNYRWRLGVELGQAMCSRQGEVLVCDDARCWQWKSGEPMRGDRVMHTATVLSDGRVLVVGGGKPAEIYDPSGGHWQSIASATGSFEFAQSVLLDDGRVLVVGSTVLDPVNAEIYDPDADSWSLTGQLNNERRFHSAARLSDGRVLVAGGYFYHQNGVSYDVLEAEVFDPQSETWSEVGSIGDAVLLPGLTVLGNNRVLLTADQSARLFDSVHEVWWRTADMAYVHEYQLVAGLPDGTVLVAGGFVSRHAEIYDPATSRWAVTGAMNDFRLAPSVTVDDSGRVFVFGGFNQRSEVVRTVEMYDPADGSWTRVAPMSSPRLAHTASVLGDGSVLITGGMHSLGEEPYVGSATVELFAPPGLEDGPRQADGRRP